MSIAACLSLCLILALDAFVLLLDVLNEKRYVDFPLPWKHVIKLGQTVFVVLHQRKIRLEVVEQAIM